MQTKTGASSHCLLMYNIHLASTEEASVVCGGGWGLKSMLIVYFLSVNRYQCTVVPPLIRTPLLSNNSILIREVSFGEREQHIMHGTCCQLIVSFLEGCPL